MSKEEHIQFWVKQVNDDFDCALALYKANHFAQSLFWAHLALKKQIKALWIKNNGSNNPPYVHNILILLTESEEIFTEEQLQFLTEMNSFQKKGRYPDYSESLEKTVTKEICEEYLAGTKEMLLCLQEKML